MRAFYDYSCDDNDKSTTKPNYHTTIWSKPLINNGMFSFRPITFDVSATPDQSKWFSVLLRLYELCQSKQKFTKMSRRSTLARGLKKNMELEYKAL